MKRGNLLFAFLLVMLPAFVYGQTVRVGLVRQFKGQSKVFVSATADFSVMDAAGNAISIPASQKLVVEASNGEVNLTQADGTETSAVGDIEISTSPKALITLSVSKRKSASYHGKILIKSDGQTLSLINLVDLEDYVKGVLPGEMPSMFNQEALKAQAVAARTYAWAHRSRWNSSSYDVCDSVHCQLYCGASGEQPDCDRAVKDTAGLIMVYDGRPIDAQYCADCGGKTQDGGSPYLVSVVDAPDGGPDYCQCREHLWSKKWSLGDFGRVLGVSDLSSIDISETDCSGRAAELVLNAGTGPALMSGLKVRQLFGEGVVKSTMFTLKSKNGDVIMKGRGFGHGIGLCQRGANGMASAPYNCNFDQILKHYYNGVQLVEVSTVRDQPMLSSRSGGRRGRVKTKKKTRH